MKLKQSHLLGGTVVVSLLIGLVLGRLFFAGTPQPPDHSAHEHATTAETSAPPTIWTCSMHPQIQQPEPGKCPICGMDLIPLEPDHGTDLGPRAMTMSESSRALAEIETSPVERAFPEATVRIVGLLDYDETREKNLSARFPARIERLFVNFTGIRVEQGEHLAEVYSPELLTAQRELLTAARNAPDSSLTAAAREKLRLWDLLPDQIDEILTRGSASDRFELRAPVGGVVVEKQVKEGDYVKTGEPLFRIVDLGMLWLKLEAYESDLPWLRYGQTVKFNVEAYPGEEFAGQIAFIEPTLDRQTRTVAVRINVPNTDGRLKPGMFARGEVKVRIAENGQVYAPDLAGKWISPMHPEIIKDHPGQCDICGMDLVPAESLGFVNPPAGEAPLVVPTSAVLRTGKRAVVYLRVPDTEQPTFEGREITLGPRAGDRYVVLGGLAVGDEVVTHGAFKIDSALQIQAKPSMMNPGPRAHGHNSEMHAAEAHGEGGPKLKIAPSLAANIMPGYLELQSALAGDNLAKAKAALRAMMDITGHNGPLPDLIHHMLGAEDLDTMRRPSFEVLSNALIAAVEQDPEAFPGSLLQMHCPMVYPDRGADWIQDTEPLQNPYFGAMMLQCGEVRGALNATTKTEEPTVDAP